VSLFLSKALRGDTLVVLGIDVLLLTWQDGGVWLWASMSCLSRMANMITGQELTRWSDLRPMVGWRK